jgi:hypothetical protein
MSILKKSDIQNIEYDLEEGFAWAESDVANSNLFQVCLVQRIDKKGFKKEIEYDNDGYLEGCCSDHNESLGYSDLFACHRVLIKACRKAGFKII